MTKVAAKYNCPIILMYSKDPTVRTTIRPQKYPDIMLTVRDFWSKRIKHATAHGIKKENIILDPGMGQFISSLPEYSFEIILRLQELVSLGHKIAIGISRKSFLGGKMSDRDNLSLAPTSLAINNGAAIIRTHDVKSIKELIKCQAKP
jgi:dihydropteroate synthase